MTTFTLRYPLNISSIFLPLRAKSRERRIKDRFQFSLKSLFFVQLWHRPKLCRARVLLLLKHASSVEQVRHLWKSAEKVRYCYCKIIDRDIGNLVRHPDIVVLLHPFRMSSFTVNSFYSVEVWDITRERKRLKGLMKKSSPYVHSWSRLHCLFRAHLR
jgi:hypothetical protein